MLWECRQVEQQRIPIRIAASQCEGLRMIMHCGDGLRIGDRRAGNRDIYCGWRGLHSTIKYHKGKTVAAIITCLRNILKAGNITIQYAMLWERSQVKQ